MTLERYITLDDLVSKAWRRILKADSHWPTELLYLNKADSLGLIRLSDLIQERKLSLIARFNKDGSEGCTLISSILFRPLNLSYTTFPTSTFPIQPFPLGWLRMPPAGWGAHEIRTKALTCIFPALRQPDFSTHFRQTLRTPWITEKGSHLEVGTGLG